MSLFLKLTGAGSGLRLPRQGPRTDPHLGLKEGCCNHGLEASSPLAGGRVRRDGQQGRPEGQARQTSAGQPGSPCSDLWKLHGAARS